MLAICSLAAVILTGCGSDDNDDGSQAGLELISGVWDAFDLEGQLVDEGYLYISPNGEITSYDYLGDSFDNGDNCYSEFFEGTVSFVSDSLYVFENVDGEERELDIRVTNDILRLSPVDDESLVDEFPRSTLFLSDLSPICDPDTDLKTAVTDKKFL